MASRSLGSLTLDLVLKMGGFSQGMDKAARESERTLNRIRTTARGIGAALTAGFAAIGASNLIGAIVRNTTEAEDALKQLEARLKSTGGVAGLTADDLTDFAKSMSEVTTFSDDAIVNMQALLLSFTNIRGPQVNGATEAILNLATAMGTDLNSAALQVGKALNDPIKGINALSRAGVQFSEDQVKLIKALVKTGDVAGAQTLILKELETQFGGAARAAADTFGGAITQLQNAFGDLLEAEGGLGDATVAIKEFTGLLRDPETVAAAQTLTSAIIKAFGGVTTAISNTVNTARFLGEELAAIGYGAAADDLVRLNEQLDQMQNLKGKTVLDKLRFFGKDGIVEFYSEEELDREIARLKQQIEETSKSLRPTPLVPIGAGGSGGAPSILGMPTIPIDPVQEVEITVKPIETTEIEKFYQQLDEMTRTQDERALASYREQKVVLETLWREGRISAEQYYARLDELNDELLPEFEVTVKKIKEEVEKSGKELNEFQREMMRNTQDIIADGLIDGFDDGAEGSLKAFGRMLAQMAAQAVAADIAGSLFGSSSTSSSSGSNFGQLLSSLAGAFAGGFATGGTMRPGQWGVVGERGPEVAYAGSAPLSITPIKSGGGDSYNFHISTPTGRVSLETQQQIASRVYQTGRRAAARTS